MFEREKKRLLRLKESKLLSITDEEIEIKIKSKTERFLVWEKQVKVICDRNGITIDQFCRLFTDSKEPNYRHLVAWNDSEDFMYEVLGN